MTCNKTNYSYFKQWRFHYISLTLSMLTPVQLYYTIDIKYIFTRNIWTSIQKFIINMLVTFILSVFTSGILNWWENVMRKIRLYFCVRKCFEKESSNSPTLNLHLRQISTRKLTIGISTLMLTIVILQIRDHKGRESTEAWIT